jgi:hypothetical protein
MKYNKEITWMGGDWKITLVMKNEGRELDTN